MDIKSSPSLEILSPWLKTFYYIELNIKSHTSPCILSVFLQIVCQGKILETHLAIKRVV